MPRSRWFSKYACICSMMTSCCSVSYYGVSIDDNAYRHINALVIFLGYVLVTLPIYYMQFLLGQYAQSGIMSLKYMSPVGHGLVYCILVLIILQSIRLSVYSLDFVIFLIHSCRMRLEWLICPPDANEFDKFCWNNTPPCNTPNCINNKTFPSTYHYYYYIYMEGKEKFGIDYELPVLYQTLLVIGYWVIICVILNLSFLNFRKVIVKLWTSIFILLMINVTFILCGRNVEVIVDMLVVNTTMILEYDAWATGFYESMLLVGLGKGVHVMHGSFIEFGDTWEAISIICVFYNYVVMFLCCFFGRGCYNIIKNVAHLDTVTLSFFWVRGIDHLFLIIPMALSLYSIPQLWNILYFLVSVLMIIGNNLVLVRTLVRVFWDAHTTMTKYSKYVACLCCVVIGGISIFLSSKSVHKPVLSTYLCNSIFNNIEGANIFLFTAFVCWVYGVQKFCDDIHYMRGSQPAKFWKVTWYCLPLVVGVVYLYMLIVIYLPSYDDGQMWMFVGSLAPLPLVLLYESLRFVRKKNIFGLFQMEEQYGPPDPRERYLRRLFNPREETKLKRRSDKCMHKCLLHSKILKRAIIEENSYKKSVSMARLEAEHQSAGTLRQPLQRSILDMHI